VTDQEKAINDVLEGIEVEIIKLMVKKQLDGRCCPEQEAKGFQEALRLCRASVRARYVEEEDEDQEDDE
jgi:hypothetical protein